MSVIGIEIAGLTGCIEEMEALAGALDERLGAFEGQSRYGKRGATESGGVCREELAQLDAMLADNIQSFKAMVLKTKGFLASVQEEYVNRDSDMAQQLANGGTA